MASPVSNLKFVHCSRSRWEIQLICGIFNPYIGMDILEKNH